ncbi:MAG: hypothetical protein HOV94_04505 [Saccharothrix sp.]|nr:hypothetical protein [Saccharothrix sp.]
MRRLLALLALPLLLSVTAVAPTGTAAAAPVGACTSTTTIEALRWGPNGNGLIVPIGTEYHGYVGSAPAIGATYRVWHVTYRPEGAVFATYAGAYAVRCAADGAVLGELDLTRTAEQTLDAFDLRCGATGFTAGSTAYQPVGSRSFLGVTWRYWRTTTTTATTPPLPFWSVTAARCA